mmetsp:Transcript_9006/g.21940  ORF Transcript_9006/g.21940 Transcript_9006/m.21940 type:complete len:234 (+) Transcript_9006:744-1445(+)
MWDVSPMRPPASGPRTYRRSRCGAKKCPGLYFRKRIRSFRPTEVMTDCSSSCARAAGPLLRLLLSPPPPPPPLFVVDDSDDPDLDFESLDVTHGACIIFFSRSFRPRNAPHILPYIASANAESSTMHRPQFRTSRCSTCLPCPSCIIASSNPSSSARRMRLAHSSGARRSCRTMAKQERPVIGTSCFERSSMVIGLDLAEMVVGAVLMLFRVRFLNIMIDDGYDDDGYVQRWR